MDRSTFKITAESKLAHILVSDFPSMPNYTWNLPLGTFWIINFEPFIIQELEPQQQLLGTGVAGLCKIIVGIVGWRNLSISLGTGNAIQTRRNYVITMDFTLIAYKYYDTSEQFGLSFADTLNNSYLRNKDVLHNYVWVAYKVTRSTAGMLIFH